MAFASNQVARRCPCNVVNALVNRHLVAYTTVTERVKGPAELVFQLLVASTPSSPCQDWVDPRSWLDRWQASKSRALLEAGATPLTAWQLNRVKCFAKRETAPRLRKVRGIQMYAHLGAQMLTGWRVTRLQKHLKSAWRRMRVGDSTVTFASGMNAEDLSEWARSVSVRALWFIELDGKNWDSTMNASLQEFKFRLFDELDPGLGELLRHGLNVRGTSRGGLVYSSHATTKSGHNDTTLGNSVINALVALTALYLLGWAGEIIVAGDDLLVAVTRGPAAPTCAPFAAIEQEFGIMPEGASFRSIQECTFISGMFLGPQCLFCPKIGRLLTRINWTCSLVGKVEVHKRGILLGLGATGRLPVIAAIVDPHQQLGEGPARAASLPYHTQAHPDVTHRDIEDHYALTPGSLDELAAFLRSASPVGYHWGMVLRPPPVAQAMIARDMGDVKDRPGVVDWWGDGRRGVGAPLPPPTIDHEG